MSEKHNLIFDGRRVTDEPSGIRRYALSLLRALATWLSEEEKLHVILPEGVSLGETFPQEITLHPVNRSIWSLKSLHQTARIVRALSPEVIHTTDPFLALTLHGRLVLTLHDSMPLSEPRFLSTFKRCIWQGVFALAQRKVKRFIFLTRSTFDVYSTYLENKKGRAASWSGLPKNNKIENCGKIIPQGIDSRFTPQAPEAVEEFLERRDIPRQYLLYIGSSAEHKNLQTLLDAWALEESPINLPLVLAGPDMGESRLRKEAEQRQIQPGRTIWLDDIRDEELPLLYSGAQALLFPSVSEGFASPVLEAMACGTPVICSATPVLKELTRGAAKIIHPTEKLEWNKTIQSAIVSLDWHQSYSTKGLQVAGRYTWREAAERTLDLYRTIYRNHTQQ